MSVTALAVQTTAITGIVPAYTAANADGHTIDNDEKTVLHVKNGSAVSVNVIADDTGSTSPTGATAFTPDVTVAVAGGAEKIIGPFKQSRFGSTVTVTFSAVTDITVAAIKLGVPAA